MERRGGAAEGGEEILCVCEVGEGESEGGGRGAIVEVNC